MEEEGGEGDGQIHPKIFGISEENNDKPPPELKIKQKRKKKEKKVC